MTDMSKAMEFEGNTIEAAVKKAVKALNVPRETLNIKLVCEEQRGLFGMAGVKPAKIKVTIKTKKA